MTLMFDPGRAAPPEGPFAPHGLTPEGGRLEVVEISEQLFHSFAEDLERLRRKIRGGETDELKESGKLVRDLRAAAQLVLEERSKLDKLRKDVAGDVGAGRLDLDAARDEIGRRLACLRRAGGG